MAKAKRNVKLKANKPKTRKEIRKEQRKMKKQRRLEYYSNRRKPGKYVLRPPDDVNDDIKPEQHSAKNLKGPLKNKNKEVPRNVPDNKFDVIENEKRKQQKLEKEMQKHRSKQLLEANMEEDRNIKKLEKQLKLNKRKSKSIPKSFASEGLDYLLEVCDSENMKGILAAEQQLNDSDGDFDEDFALMTNQSVENTKKPEKLNKNQDKDDESDRSETESENDIEANLIKNYEDSSSDNEEDVDRSISNSETSDNHLSNEESDENQQQIKRKRKSVRENSLKKKQKSASNEISNSESDIQADDDENISNDDNDDPANQSDTWEDIYGRIRGKDGSVITNSGKYIPPAIRAQIESEFSDDKKRKEKLDRLKKQLKGLLNRLAEANMHSISTQIEDLYMNNSRNDMNDSITTLILDSITSKVITPERLLIEHVLLVTILHANVGTEVGAHFLHAVTRQFDKLFNSEQEIENKMLDNTVTVISQLYNFKVFHSQLLYQILSKLSSKFNEKCIECILAVLRNVGFSLRKDDPLALKAMIIELQKQVANVSDETKENSRIKYMLDILLAVKNNNMSKIPNYDTSYSEHLKKLQKSFIRKGNYVTQLNISLDDLLQADERGKWWIVGSAWSGAKEDDPNKNKVINTEKYSQKLLDLARKQRMNTDTRKNIFCIIMSAEDYLDAFEKLLHLGLKNQQEREIIHVVLHCCLQEKKFNPYYAVLAQKFCEYDRRYQMTIKFSVWDKLKALTDCSASQISNLAKLLTHLFLEKGLPISTLKIMQFGELDKITLRFIRQILLGILLCEETESCTGVFEKVAMSDKLKMFRESMRLFIHHFLLKNLKTDNVPEDQKALLKTRADIVEKMLTINDKRTRF